jgi:lysylphosphatidylglycerol synthetase-like protein (DUF2156 family)
MREIMYEQSSILIVAILFLGMLLSIEISFRIRSRRRKPAIATEAITQANAVLVSMLGLLALLLAFTFSAALQRYDDRSRAVMAEANAIGTTYLRAQLLPKGMQDEVQATLRQYLDLRIREGRADFADAEERELLHQAKPVEAQLWSQAVQAAEQDGRPVTSGLFIQSLNELIDASAARRAANNRHVPEVVIFLMFATVLIATATLGFASGIAGHRVTLAAFALVVLITLVIYIIIDMDRPRRGSIQVSQESMLSLQKSIGAQGTTPQLGSPSNLPQAPSR